MQIDLAHRSTSSWLDAADLAREVYAQAYGADVAPRPDSFIVARPACGAVEEPCAPLACAGLTFGSDQELFSERYLETGVEDAALARLEPRSTAGGWWKWGHWPPAAPRSAAN